jgi:hypothetical protein
MLGTSTVTLIAPSQIWPFRKIFLPPALPSLSGALFARAPYPGRLALSEADIEAIELEFFRKEFPAFLFRNESIYKRLKGHRFETVMTSGFRVPMNITENGSVSLVELDERTFRLAPHQVAGAGIRGLEDAPRHRDRGNQKVSL